MNSKQITSKLKNAVQYFSYGDAKIICNGYMNANFLCMLDAIEDFETLHRFLIIHPGTKHLLTLATVVMALCSFIDDTDIDIENYLSKFHDGDMIVYNNERYYYHGITAGSCILTSDDTKNFSKNTRKIPLKLALNIRRYKGQAVTTGRYRTALNDAHSAALLLKSIIGSEFEKIIAIMPRSVLVLCEKDKADDIANNVIISEKERTFRFADVFPCAWVGSSEEEGVHYYFGSAGKADPVILFTNRAYIAREIMYDDEAGDDRIFSVIVDNAVDNTTGSEIKEICEIMERKSVGYYWILQSEENLSMVDSSFYESFRKVLFWTPDLLLSKIDHLYSDPLSQVDDDISCILRRAVNLQAERRPIACGKELQNLQQCKKVLRRLMRKRYDDENLDEFILCAHGLINVFEQTCFPLEQYEEKIRTQEIRARSPQTQVEKLYNLCHEIDDSSLQEMASEIVLGIDACRIALQKNNPKNTTLVEMLSDVSQTDIRTLVVVTKKSYLLPTEEICQEYPNTFVSLYSSFQKQTYNRIIYIAMPNPKRGGFNPLSDTRSEQIIFLEYPSERIKNVYYQHKITASKAAVKSIADSYAAEAFDIDVDLLEETDENADYDEIEEDAEGDLVSSEIEMANIETDVIVHHAAFSYHDSGTSSTKVIRLAQFQNGDCALFSRNYKGYVVEGTSLIEKPVDKLQIGDELVFPALSGEICDIVNVYLKQLVDNDQTLNACYDRSVRWKRVLQDYMKNSACTYEDIAESMAQLGHERHPQTVKHWLDEETTIVGPHDAEAFLAIGLVTGDMDMQEHYELYKESCDRIRKYRIKILNHLQNSAIHSVGKDLSANEKLSPSETQLLAKANMHTKRLIIERIVPCEKEVPSYLINKPIDRR